VWSAGAGKIVTIETVALKLPRKQWKCHDINPDQTCYADDYMRHVLYITRIYFRYGTPDPEFIGAHFTPQSSSSPAGSESVCTLQPTGWTKRFEYLYDKLIE